jgi:nitrate reductase cytochrome c-type subunit
MTRLIKILAVAGLTAVLALPVMVCADEAPANYAADANKTGGDPPTVPHKMKEGDTGKSCLVCHEKGLNKAPETSHPERIDCVQCHVQGEIKKKAVKKQSKSK